MSQMSELHHDQRPEPERPYTTDEWVEVRRRAAMEAWADTNRPMDFDAAFRFADAVLRYAMPERVPPNEGV